MQKISNVTLWNTAEGLAKDYAKETDAVKKDAILGDLFFTLNDYMITCVRKGVKNAKDYGLEIPKEDFESRVYEYLWNAIEAYEIDGKSTFKNIAINRIKFAEIHTFRQYIHAGSKDDKDGKTYNSARWDSLDRQVGGSEGEESKTMADVVLGDTESAELEYMDNTDEGRIIAGFKDESSRYANVIHFMSKGYDGDALAQITGESDTYDSKMRKLVQRAKKAFAEYMN